MIGCTFVLLLFLPTARSGSIHSWFLRVDQPKSLDPGSLAVVWNDSLHYRHQPLFIYHDEIANRTDFNDIGLAYSGALICIVDADEKVTWEYPNGTYVTVHDEDFIVQHRSWHYKASILSLENYSESLPSGLWKCRAMNTWRMVPVGIYVRGSGLGRITSVSITFSYYGNNRIHLIGFSMGGPPTTSVWTRDGFVVAGTKHGAYSIDLSLSRRRSESTYVSRLTATGYLPGKYEYSVYNEATTRFVRNSFQVDGGGEVSDVQSVQTGPKTAYLSWRPPKHLPSRGYRIFIPGHTYVNNYNRHATSYEATLRYSGSYTFRILAISGNYPSKYVVHPFIIKGLNGPIIDPQLSARYAHILVIDNPSSFPFDSYNISLVRKNASYQVCKDLGPPDKRFLVKPQGNITFTDLEENSAYTVKVVVYISHKYGAGFRSSIKDFTTLIAVPSAGPKNMTYTATQTTIIVKWPEIDCIDHNGPLLGYEGKLQKIDSSAVYPGIVNGRTFVAQRLTPYTVYIFQAAGKTKSGTGTFSAPFVVLTNDGFPGPVHNITARARFNLIDISWKPPEKPNGIMTGYDVTYTVRKINTTVSVDLSATYSIPVNLQEEHVPIVTVTPYTRSGPGESASIFDLTTKPIPPMVVDVRGYVRSTSSVEMYWMKSSVPESESYRIVGYQVYYRETVAGLFGRKRQEFVSPDEETVGVSELHTSVVIEFLRRDTDYQFQVAALADFDGDLATGQRSRVVNIRVAYTNIVPGTDKVVTASNPVFSPSESISPLARIIGSVVAFVFVGATILIVIVLTSYWSTRKKLQHDDESESSSESSEESSSDEEDEESADEEDD